MTPQRLPALLLTREQPALVQRFDRNRELVRVRAGVYVRKAEWAPLAPWNRYLLRVHAVSRTWTAPTFCLESAAALAQLPVFGEPREIHLLSDDGSTWREGDVVVHGSRDVRATESRQGLMLTTIAETAVDLCRVLPPAFALATADAALRRLREEGAAVDLSAAGRAQSNRRGLRQLDWVQARATPIAESVGESVSRAVIEWLGYQHPELQTEFWLEGAHDRVDFFWRDRRIIGESDGYGKYDADDPGVTKANLIAEKKREDRLRRHSDGFARWDWTDTMKWTSLDRKLAASGLIRTRPLQPGMLATLAANARSLPPAARTKGGSAKQGATP